MGSILNIFSPEKKEVPEAGGKYILMTEKGRCRIERRPDDRCYFYDENGAEWCLFGLTIKKFELEAMVHVIIRRKLKNERFMDRAISLVEYDYNLAKMSPGGKRKAIWKVMEEPDLDVLRLTSLLWFGPTSDEEILGSRGKLAILVRKKDGHIMQTTPITRVDREIQA